MRSVLGRRTDGVRSTFKIVRSVGLNFSQSLLQEAALARIGGKSEGTCVTPGGLLEVAMAAEKISACCVQ